MNKGPRQASVTEQKNPDLPSLSRRVVRSQRFDVAFVTLGSCYVIAGIVVAFYRRTIPLIGLWQYTIQFAALLLLYPAAYMIAQRWSLRNQPATVAYPEAWARTRWALLVPARFAPFVVLGLGLVVVLSTFTTLKLTVGTAVPFRWDVLFTEWGRTLHGGRLPWEWLQPWLGHPWITRVLDWLYFALWWPIVFGVFAWQAWAPHSAGRRRYLLVFLGTWIVFGTALALLGASAGPQFYGHVVEGPNPFAGLTAYLDSVSTQGSPLITTQVRDWLWLVHTGGHPRAGGGIAAMPSLHVALSELCAIVGRARSRRAGLALTAYSMVTLVGSVALGPHYALDGYVSWLGVHALWWGAGLRMRGSAAQSASIGS